jgi:predicted flap endonuclease-1-like 5' DNA nuclease
MLENICQYFPAMIIIGTLLGAVSGWFFKKITTYLNTKDLQEALADKESELITIRQEVQNLEFEHNRSKKEAIDLMEELDHAKIATMTYQSQMDKQQVGIDEKEQTILLLNDKINYFESKWSQIEELSKTNEDLTANIGVLNIKINELKDEILKKDALIVHKSKQLEIEEINQRKIILEGEEIVFQRDALKAKNTALSIELEGLKKQEISDTALSIMNKELSIKVENLTSQINELKTSNVLLIQENTVVDIGKIMDLKQEIADLRIELTQKDALIMATGTLPVEIRGYRSRILELENKEEKLGKEVSILSTELKQVTSWIKKKKNKSGKNNSSNNSNSSNNGVKIEAENAIVAQIRLNAHKIPFGKIGLRLDEQKDDLTKIKSITQRIEIRLNAAGINSYVQLVRMQEAQMIIIAEVIQIEVKIIISGNWKSQARVILTEISAGNPKDDLEKIEGIGPKIEELYFNNGIYSFRDLSKMDNSALKHILSEGGKRFNRHNPETWAKQAELAAEGKWEELKNWQDELDGGKLK